ncbi:hypothetical protein INH39_32170 [Massilia violaceinigra]|uniref:Lipoprotein n=1 Tax=Massilia violaceinigra TaxID=2045208 RepID=A0ABY4A5A4_9BURK|nr:hypothetical protein [Massilia violaceinigra]UOD29959.1 hypothetical protein INH39_32170 [Massilia violaceinigra]
MSRATLCALTLLAASGAALAQSCNRNEDDGDHLHPWEFCDDDFRRRQLAQFKDFPAEPAARFTPVLTQRLAGADAATNAAWMEAIRRELQSQQGLFAGHYLFVHRGGCGAGCHQSLIVDLRNGRIHAPDQINLVQANVNNLTPTLCKKLDIDCMQDTYTFRKDSKLLVVVGALGEDAEKRGIYHFRWDDDKLALVSKLEKSPYDKPTKRAR